MTLLNHEYIVRLLDVYQDEMTMFIVMEFVGHGPLTEYVTKNGALPESTVKRLTTSLLFAIEHMHAKGIVHRDLKPANCLITSIDYRPSENMMTAVANRRTRGWSLLRRNKSNLAAQVATENNNQSVIIVKDRENIISSPVESVTMYNNIHHHHHVHQNQNQNGASTNSLGGSPRTMSPSGGSPGIPPLHHHQQHNQLQAPSWFVTNNHNNTNNNINNNNNNVQNRSNSSSPKDLDMTMTHPAPTLQNASFCSVQSAGSGEDATHRTSSAPRSGGTSTTNTQKTTAKELTNTHTQQLQLQHHQQQQHGDPILGIKICDLGMATMVGSGSCLTNYAGTPSFLAPEITLAERTRTPYGKPVDMWSLGVMIYWLSCARMPFSKHALHECTAESLTPTFEEPEWTKFSKEAKEFIRSLLTFDPNRRVTAKVALKDKWITSAYELSEADSNREALIERLAEKAEREGEDAAFREIAEVTKVKTRRIGSMRAAVAIVIAAHRLIFFSSVKRLVRHGCSNELISAVNRGLMSFFLGGDYDPPSHAIRARRLLRRPLTPPPKKITSSSNNNNNSKESTFVSPASRTLSPPSKTTDDTTTQPSSSSSATMIATTALGGLSTHACDFVCTLLENAPRVTHFDVADNGIESIDTVQRIVRAAQGHRGLVELSLAENPLHPLAGRTLLRFARNAVSPNLTRVDVHGCANLPNDLGSQLSVAIKERIEQLRANPQKALAMTSNNNSIGNDYGNYGGNINNAGDLFGSGGTPGNSSNNDLSGGTIRIRKRSASTTTATNNRMMSASTMGRTGGVHQHHMSSANNNNHLDDTIMNNLASTSSNMSGSGNSNNNNNSNNDMSNNSSSANRYTATKAEWSLEYSIMRHLRAANPSRGIFAETISSANRRSASSGGVMSFSTSYQLPPLQRASTPLGIGGNASTTTSSSSPMNNLGMNSASANNNNNYSSGGNTMMNNTNNNFNDQGRTATRANTTIPPHSLSSSSSFLSPTGLPPRGNTNLSSTTPTNNNASNSTPNTSSPSTRNLHLGNVSSSSSSPTTQMHSNSTLLLRRPPTGSR